MNDNIFTGNKVARDRFSRLKNEVLQEVTPHIGFFHGIKRSYADLWERRSLFYLFTKRELKARYKDSTLGYVWTLIRPLINLLIYYLVIGKVLGAQRAIPDFAIYVFAGLTVWNLFSMIVSGSTSSIVANSGIIKKVYLPRELFPLTATASALVDFCSQFLILLVAALYISGISVVPFLVYVPLSLLVVLVWGIACGLILSAINVYLRDVQYLVEVLLMIGFWFTPTVYSFAMLQDLAGSWLTELYLLNPITLAVMGFQRGTWAAGVDQLWPSHLFDRLLIVFLIGIIVVFAAQRIFALLQRNFAQEL